MVARDGTEALNVELTEVSACKCGVTGRILSTA